MTSEQARAIINAQKAVDDERAAMGMLLDASWVQPSMGLPGYFTKRVDGKEVCYNDNGMEIQNPYRRWLVGGGDFRAQERAEIKALEMLLDANWSQSNQWFVKTVADPNRYGGVRTMFYDRQGKYIGDDEYDD